MIRKYKTPNGETISTNYKCSYGVNLIKKHHSKRYIGKENNILKFKS